MVDKHSAGVPAAAFMTAAQAVFMAALLAAAAETFRTRGQRFAEHAGQALQERSELKPGATVALESMRKCGRGLIEISRSIDEAAKLTAANAAPLLIEKQIRTAVRDFAVFHTLIDASWACIPPAGHA